MNERKTKFWLIGLVALFSAGFVAFAIVEGGVLLRYGEQAKFPRRLALAPWGLWYNEPGAEYRHKSPDGTWWFEINAQGMRDDRDVRYEKPLGITRIISLGDSFTIGYGVDLDQTFTRVMETELLGAGHHVQALNAGVFGFSTAEEVLYLERELLRYDPDLVLISFYADDPGESMRSGLFSTKDGPLTPTGRDLPVPGAQSFIAGSGLLDRLSEYSNAFALLAERVRSQPAPSEGDSGLESEITAAILQRAYEQLRRRGVALIIQSIPTKSDETLVDRFPPDLDLSQPGLYFVSMRDELQPHLGRQPLYWERSQSHWTWIAHEISGRSLARLVLEERLLVPDSRGHGLAD